jgi:two-component system, cell cycle response regulator CtrA
MRAFVLTDDTVAARNIETRLARENFICDTAGLDEDSFTIYRLYDYDVILVDLSATNIAGCRLVQRLRAAGVRTPVLVMAPAVAVEEKIGYLGLGADDFLTKPWDDRELLARIKAIIRRSNGHFQSEIRTGTLVVNLDTRMASVSDKPVSLTKTEYRILELLSLRKGAILTKDTFLDHLYGGVDEPGPKIIDVYICKLRRKLAEATGGRHYIATVHGRGYVMRDPPSAAPSGNVPSRLGTPAALLTAVPAPTHSASSVTATTVK